MLLYVVYEEEGILDTSGIGTSETALQCNFELIPVQIDTLVSYVPGSSVALIVISLIVSGSVTSPLRRSFASQPNHKISQTASWSPVTVSTVGPCRMSPFQVHSPHCRSYRTGANCNQYFAIHIRVVNPLLHNVLPASYVTHRTRHQSVIPSVYRLAP